MSDIIDGFGSYTDHFMRYQDFRGTGGISYKYYCLFQHLVTPPKSTFTTSAPQTSNYQDSYGLGLDPARLKITHVHEEPFEDPSFILGARPGPYITGLSRSL